MRDPVPALGVLLGLGMAVYGLASLTGGWLGTPPWWSATERQREVPVYWFTAPPGFRRNEIPRHAPEPAQPEVGAGVVAAGLLLATSCAGLRRHPLDSRRAR